MEPHSSTSKKVVFNQQHQTVLGNQFNIGNVEGEMKVQLPPLEPSRAVPPAPPPDFVGRTEQLAQLAATLTAGHSAAIIALHGMGGIGKTALAQQLAAILTPHFRSGIFWADLALHAGSAESILRTWGALCGADLSQEPNSTVLAEWVRALLAARCEAQGALLVVLDDVRAEWLTTARLLKQSLPAAASILLTARDVDLAAALDAEVVQLDVLPEESAYNLLANRVKPQTILTPESTVKSLLKQLGYLPLAIRLAAAYASKMARKPGFELNQFVTDVATRAMSLLDAPGGNGLAATFEISYAALGAEQQRVFRYCSVYSPALLTVEHMAGLLVLEPTAVESALDGLVTAALLEWDQQVARRYVLHPLLRQYGYALLQDLEMSQTVHQQAAEYLLTLVQKRGYTPEEILEEVDQREKAQQWETMALHASVFVDILAQLGYWDEIECRLIKAQKHIQGVTNNERLVATLWNSRGNIANLQVRWEHAISCYERALIHFEHLGDNQGVARTYNNLGTIYCSRGELDKALAFQKQSLAIKKQLGDRYDMALAYQNLGAIYQRKGDWEQAVDYYEQALQICEQVGNARGVAQITTNLGVAYEINGYWDKAISFYEQSFATYKQTGDIYGAAKTLMGLGVVYVNKGSLDNAMQIFKQALKFFETVGDRNGIAQIKINLGTVYGSNGDWDKAINHYEQSLATLDQMEDSYSIAVAKIGLGNAYRWKEESNKASSFYEQALAIYEQLGNSQGIAYAKAGLGSVYQQKGDLDKAINFYEQALPTIEMFGDRLGLAEVYEYLGSCYQSHGDTEQAVYHFARAFLIFHHLSAAQSRRVEDYLVQILGSPESVNTYLKQLVQPNVGHTLE